MTSPRLNQQQNTNGGELITTPLEVAIVTQPGTSNEVDLSDSSIMADREANLQVTAWVRTNYVQEREHNVPRRNMFEHYKSYCTSAGLSPVNSATFGKLLRSVFPELKTRRLGVRGQSKYHYCGIRVRTEEDPIEESTAIIPYNHHQPPPPVASSSKRLLITTASPRTPQSPSSGSKHGVQGFAVPAITSFRFNPEHDNNAILSFTTAYEKHCNEIFSLLTAFQPEKIKDTMTSFYKDMPDEHFQIIENLPEISEAVWRWDCVLYDSIIEHFVPAVNHPISPDMVKSLRTYTRELGEYIDLCMINYPSVFYQKKGDVARIFAAKCRRQLSLYSAAQSASSILNMNEHLMMMRHDWENFNFEGILDQTLWVCECDTAHIRKILYTDVTELLNSKVGIEHWMRWITNHVEKHLKSFTPSNMNDASHYLTRSKQLLLKWNFYTSLIIKDLALHQCGSFGSFHSLKVFLDDYILFVVEENIAQVNYSLMQQHQMANDNINQYYSPSTASPSSSITK